MARKRPGIQGPGRERLRQNWEDIEAGRVGNEPSWLVGQQSEENLKLREDVAATNLAEQQFMETEEVESLDDLWPDKSNYYQGPTQSTRVSRHRFVPERSVVFVVQGTMYFEFTNMRNGRVRRTNVYRYNKVPYPVYKDFTMATSKGQKINVLDKVYQYERIDDTSVFNV
jgi:hypothetical protein